LERVLQAVREGSNAPLTVVFGCGGDRDAGKRPQMGAIAGKLADRVIVTSDNPRTEDPQQIADAIIAGTSGNVECIIDRHTAIERAVLDAPSPAVVVIAGKGAETEQIIGTQKHLFDDRREVERALERRARAKGEARQHV
jgi:UDP-N-acetylmuramoyl-L-alanyl-D-glutamate--2,6-diaminopimelate ligase